MKRKRLVFVWRFTLLVWLWWQKISLLTSVASVWLFLFLWLVKTWLSASSHGNSKAGLLWVLWWMAQFPFWLSVSIFFDILNRKISDARFSFRQILREIQSPLAWILDVFRVRQMERKRKQFLAKAFLLGTVARAIQE